MLHGILLVEFSQIGQAFHCVRGLVAGVIEGVVMDAVALSLFPCWH